MEHTTINGIVIRTTPDAALVEVQEVDGCFFDDDDDKIWFPYSQCDGLDEDEEGEETEFECPDWLADEKGLL